MQVNPPEVGPNQIGAHIPILSMTEGQMRLKDFAQPLAVLEKIPWILQTLDEMRHGHRSPTLSWPERAARPQSSRRSQSIYNVHYVHPVHLGLSISLETKDLICGHESVSAA